MNTVDPRWVKTVHVFLLMIFSFWVGGLDARATFSTKHWVMLVVYIMGIVCALVVLLQDTWKRPT
jgi:hypothetical protein